MTTSVALLSPPREGPQPTGPAGTSAAPAGTEALQLRWSPPPGLAWLSFRNLLLKIVTLGFYRFWAKTEVRKRIWAGVRINGEPLQYTGTGKELLIGFAFIVAVLTMPALLASLAIIATYGPRSWLLDASQLAFGLLTFYLVGVGAHRGLRYRLSRTHWRGIHGGLDGSAWAYGWTYFWSGPGLLALIGAGAIALAGANAGWQVLRTPALAFAFALQHLWLGLLVVAAMSWILPWRATRLQSRLTNGMRFGNRAFRFDATAGPLYKSFAVLWLATVAIVVLVLLGWWGLTVSPALLMAGSDGRITPGRLFLTIALYYGVLVVGLLLFASMSAWYRARMMNHFAAHTSFDGVRFSGTATGPSLVWLTVSNWAIVLFTLGVLAPVAQARAARYFVERLQLEGSAALAEVLQRAAGDGTRGEGLAQAFDIDAF